MASAFGARRVQHPKPTAGESSPAAMAQEGKMKQHCNSTHDSSSGFLPKKRPQSHNNSSINPEPITIQ